MIITAPEGATITYQLQRRSCGKTNCTKCKPGGPKHGPYWYGFFHEGKKIRSFYVGKEKPKEEATNV